MNTARDFRRTLCFVAALLGLATSASAQQANWAEKMFEERSFDFGTVARGADVRHRFKVTNLYQQQVHIANVRTTCGCSAANPSQSTLASREIAHIEVTFDTHKFTRQKDSTLIVTFDAPLYAEIRIPLTAYIRTDVVLEPGAVNFGAVDRGSEKEQRIEIAYAGRDDWTIREVRTDNEHLTARVAETSRSGGRVNYELFVTLKPSAPVGVLRDQLTLVTDDARSPQVPVLVSANVEADITITPARVSLGTLAPGQSKPANVVLRGKKPFTIEKVECASDADAFQVRLPKNEQPVHVLPLTFTAPDRPGDFVDEITVTIAGRPEPVTFQAYGTISSQ